MTDKVKTLTCLSGLFFGAATLAVSAAAQEPSVRVEPSHLQGPRVLADQTASGVVRDYLEAWKTVGNALSQNRLDLLERDFTGTARDKLRETIQEQSKSGLTTRYQDLSHDLQIVFYSPEGLSIQLIDKVTYSIDVLDQGKVVTSQKVASRYNVVMTPAEVRWRVRIFQADPQN